MITFLQMQEYDKLCNVLTGKSFSETDSVSVGQKVQDFIAQKFHKFPPISLMLNHIYQGHSKGLIPTRHSSGPLQNTGCLG